MEQYALKQKAIFCYKWYLCYRWFFFDISIDIERWNYMHFASVNLSFQGLMALRKFTFRFKFKHVPEFSARLGR